MKIDNIHPVSADKLKGLAKEHLDRVDRDRIELATSRARRETWMSLCFLLF